MTFKYQESFAGELYHLWLDGKDTHVRNTIRQLKNKAQSAYICGVVVYYLGRDNDISSAGEFIAYMHPDFK